jgi:hypothetical protein
MNFKKMLMLLALVSSLTFTSAKSYGGDQHQAISAGDRALATWQVQNLMSKHEYYHAAGLNTEEIDALWVSPTGDYGKTACFFSPSWVMQGVATVRKLYGEGHQADKEKAFKELTKVYPELANMDPKTANIGGEFAMHTSTTPIIEVAGDGKTAKGVWYSPGMGLMPHINGDAVQVGAIFFWEKYAGDFVMENGQWKIWHLGMYYDFTPPLPDSMTANLNKGKASSDAAGGPPPPAQDNREKGETMTPEQIAAGGMLPQPYSYENWNPKRKNQILPKLPESYFTFTETFSYAPYDKNNQNVWQK